MFSSECVLFSCWFTDTCQIICEGFLAKYIWIIFRRETGQALVLLEKRAPASSSCVPALVALLFLHAEAVCGLLMTVYENKKEETLGWGVQFKW